MIYNDQITYKRAADRMGRNATTCHLAIYQNDEQTLVVATEIHTNEGMSITNSSEDMASAVVKEFDLNPDTTTFVEHYNAASYTANPSALAMKQHPDTYARVQYTWRGLSASKPQWSRLSEEAYEIVLEHFR